MGTRGGVLAVALGTMVMTLVLASCDFRRISINDPIEPDDVTFIAPGRTTLSEVVAHLGAPDEVTGSDEQIVFRYRFRVARIFRVNFGRLLSFWSPVTPNMSLGRGEVGTDVFQVVFDRNWIAQGHAFAQESDTSRYRFWPF